MVMLLLWLWLLLLLILLSLLLLFSLFLLMFSLIVFVVLSFHSRQSSDLSIQAIDELPMEKGWHSGLKFRGVSPALEENGLLLSFASPVPTSSSSSSSSP